jgi:hypothetical protein
MTHLHLPDSCSTCGCNYCLVIIFSVDEPSTIESRETAIPSSHDMKLSQAIPQHRPMNREVRDTILQLLEQNRFTKNYGPKRIMSELRRHNISAGTTYPKFGFLVGCKSKI